MDNNGRPDHIEDYLAQLHKGQWFGWSDSKNKIHSNLLLTNTIWSNKVKISNPHSLPTEQECTDGLAQLQTDFDDAKTKHATDSSSGKAKLKALGLSDDEIKALTGK